MATVVVVTVLTSVVVDLSLPFGSLAAITVSCTAVIGVLAYVLLL